MAKYIPKRIVAGMLTTFVLITATFSPMRAMSGGLFSPTEEKNLPGEEQERINQKYGLARPVWEQYMMYLGDLVKGDFGISHKQLDVSVNELIQRGFPILANVGAAAARA